MLLPLTMAPSSHHSLSRPPPLTTTPSHHLSLPPSSDPHHLIFSSNSQPKKQNPTPISPERSSPAFRNSPSTKKMRAISGNMRPLKKEEPPRQFTLPRSHARRSDLSLCRIMCSCSCVATLEPGRASSSPEVGEEYRGDERKSKNAHGIGRPSTIIRPPARIFLPASGFIVDCIASRPFLIVFFYFIFPLTMLSGSAGGNSRSSG
ncbi:hypothetical protein EDB81DRAFT_82952 [Dactylonectria macrodidyma]|uniref:Uncharacterized protein n=1 Tax=Dactylonectria macrodidyma TaxID=307937 RepID=A0A9P9EFL2_9HYPO|nr:hypothetical protein EDB81DRAFT_82952 [Dactylonectria macrodidyma]